MKKIILTVKEMIILKTIMDGVHFWSVSISEKIETVLGGKKEEEIVLNECFIEVSEDEKSDFLDDLREAKEDDRFYDNLDTMTFIIKLEDELMSA